MVRVFSITPKRCKGKSQHSFVNSNTCLISHRKASNDPSLVTTGQHLKYKQQVLLQNPCNFRKCSKDLHATGKSNILPLQFLWKGPSTSMQFSQQSFDLSVCYGNLTAPLQRRLKNFCGFLAWRWRGRIFRWVVQHFSVFINILSPSMRSIPSQLNVFLIFWFFFVLKWFSTKNFQTTTKSTLHLLPMVKVRKITKNNFSPKGKKWPNTEIQIHF